MISLYPITEDVAVMAAAWRNANPQALRTDEPSTDESQIAFWNRLQDNKTMRYWGIYEDKVSPVGICGLTDMKWSAEVSLLIDPNKRGNGYGKKALNSLLSIGFYNYKLLVIYGEVYLCNDALPFWEKALASYDVRWTSLPARKLWDGRVWGSRYFSINSPYRSFNEA